MAIFFKSPQFYWQNQVRWVSGNRLAWFGEEPTEDFWLEYWSDQIQDNGYYQSAYDVDLINTLPGGVFLKELTKNGIHLEAGCGAGYWVAALKHAGYTVQGLEYSKPLVELVKSVNPELPVEHGNALAIPVPDNYYESYISFGVVEHTVEGPQAFLAEAHRVLKPNGKIIISVPFYGPTRKLKARIGMYSKHKPDLSFFQYGFDKADFARILTAAGFTVKSMHLLSDIHRLLVEEVPFYRWLSYQRGGYSLRRIVKRLLAGYDGHMILFVGYKSYEIS
jgi:SAM-dependent methyltransferase